MKKLWGKLPIAKPEYCRINPDTNEPFKPWDPRPRKNIEITVSKRTGKRMWHAEKIVITTKSGKKKRLVKSYPVDDGFVFQKYYTKGRKNDNGEIVLLSAFGKYYEQWTIPKEVECDDCGVIFLALRVQTTDSKKARNNYCPDCRKNTMREGTFAEWKERGWAQCLRTDLIAKITGCPGDKVPFEDFNAVKHSIYDSDQLLGYCKDCEKVRAHMNHARRNFNLTHEQYYEQIKRQDFHCMMCPNEISYDGSALNIDHDHDYDGDDTKQFNRGFLCKSCNFLVGERGVNESVELAENLYHYLLRAESIKIQFKDHPEMLEQGGFPQVKVPKESTKN